MNGVSRRHFVAGASVACLAGCPARSFDTDSDSDGDADGASNGASGDSSTTETIFDDNDTVREDYYRTYEFTLNRQVTLDLRVTVRSGPAVDIILTTPDEFDEYEERNRFRYNEDLSLLDTTGGDTSMDAPAGDYVLIVDNTEMGEAQPPSNFDDDPATYDIELTGR